MKRVSRAGARTDFCELFYDDARRTAKLRGVHRGAHDPDRRFAPDPGPALLQRGKVSFELPMIYIEFTSRRPQPGLREHRGTLAVESFESQLQRFHRAVLAGQSGWEESWSEDQMILSIGRTWRLGPEPEYMTVWHTPSAGLGRIDAWDKVFRSGEADELEQPFREVARIERAGCYEALLDPVRQPTTSAEATRSEPSPRTQGGIYYAEFFEPSGPHDAIRELYVKRAASHAKLTLALCIVRIGKLAPEPGGLAVWTLPSYGALATIARDLDGMIEPVRLTTAGVYNDVGTEIL